MQCKYSPLHSICTSMAADQMLPSPQRPNRMGITCTKSVAMVAAAVHMLGTCAYTRYFYSRFTKNGLTFTPSQNALRRANPWVQDLGKHPSILAPPKVKIHKIAPWEQPPPWFGVSVLDC